MEHTNDVKARTFEDASKLSYVSSTFVARFCAIPLEPALLACEVRNATAAAVFVCTLIT